MKTIRWVFIRPRNHSPYYDPEIQEPLGLEYLTASRMKKGDHVLLLDAVLDSISEVKLARRAASFMPDAIGFSIMTGQEVESATAIYHETKRALNGKKVYWLAGGNFITFETNRALNLLPDDFILVRFEGESALEQLAESWGSTPYTGKPAAKSFQRVIAGPQVHDLDTLHFPFRPFAHHIENMGGAFTLQGSRGCCGACKYCASPGARRAQAAPWRGRSMEHIVAEIAELHHRFGAASFNFIDEDFLGPNRVSLTRAQKFVQELKRRKLKISFSIQVRPDSLNDEIIDLLCENGLSYIFIGIESDNPADFKNWGRPWVDNPWPLIRRLQRHHVEVGAGTLLFHPDSTLNSIRRFSCTLRKYKLLNYRSAINRMDAMPGSMFYKTEFQKENLDRTPGPRRLPFHNKEIEAFYEDLTMALSPVGPPSMHAVCSLPPLISQCKFRNEYDDRYYELRRIIDYLDEAVSRTLFLLLEYYETDTIEPVKVSMLRKDNFQTALTATQDLSEHGFAISYDTLRQAIRIDSGL
ncbi:B12-binding domain-containing radical SAM protein [Desulfobacter curvatus]|uniref:B12-binding domain-containing radical SAM protein n=1 Tax=Desulfobacter curvatus TaxID=2290 RepID=UPI0003690CD2|nr:B12-binding domain-containing radical SAM protein [Desulfobacter curvatus]